MSDVTHGHELGHNDRAYSDNKLLYNTWELSRHSMCVTYPAAEALRRLERTKYVTRARQGNLPRRARDFLDDSHDNVEQAPATTDNLDLYLTLAEDRKDICVLPCWRNLQLSAPRVAEMACQCLATPGSSAGVERLFSAAGLTYDDLSGAMTEDTSGQRLLAMCNYSPALYIEKV